MVSADALIAVRHTPLRWRWGAVGLTLGLVGWYGSRWLRTRPDLAEQGLASGLHPVLVRGLSVLSGWIPVSLAEGVVALVAGLLLVGAIRGVGAARRTREPPLRLGLRGLLRVVGDAGVLFFAFQLLWGVQYARPALEPRLGIPAVGEIPDDELIRLAEIFVERTNLLYLQLHGEGDIGAPTPTAPRSEIGAALNEGWAGAVARWDLPVAMASPRGAPKTFLLTRWVRRFGMTGMYMPFTGEALLMADLPGATQLFTAAHESAHQRGVARESDANALGYLVGLETGDVRLRYAAALFLQRQALISLSGRDLDTTMDLVAQRLPGVQRDIEAIAERARSVAGRVRTVTTRANDVMLRSQGIPEGVANYAGSLWIVAALAREYGTEALLPPL
jgi:hypothetical protein